MNSREVGEPEVGGAGHAVDGAVGDQPAAGGEHDELPEVRQQAAGRAAEQAQQLEHAGGERHQRDHEDRHAAGVDELLGMARLAAAQHERAERERDRDREQQEAVRALGVGVEDPRDRGQQRQPGRQRGDQQRRPPSAAPRPPSPPRPPARARSRPSRPAAGCPHERVARAVAAGAEVRAERVGEPQQEHLETSAARSPAAPTGRPAGGRPPRPAAARCRGSPPP